MIFVAGGGFLWLIVSTIHVKSFSEGYVNIERRIVRRFKPLFRLGLKLWKGESEKHHQQARHVPSWLWIPGGILFCTAGGLTGEWNWRDPPYLPLLIFVVGWILNRALILFVAWRRTILFRLAVFGWGRLALGLALILSGFVAIALARAFKVADTLTANFLFGAAAALGVMFGILVLTGSLDHFFRGRVARTVQRRAAALRSAIERFRERIVQDGTGYRVADAPTSTLPELRSVIEQLEVKGADPETLMRLRVELKEVERENRRFLILCERHPDVASEMEALEDEEAFGVRQRRASDDPSTS